MSHLPHSELEVVPGSLESREVPKYTHYSTVNQTDNDTHNYTHGDTNGTVTHEKAQPRTIYGLRKKTFWIIVIVAIVVVVISVGAGVGAGLSHNKTPSASSTTPTPTPTSAETSTRITTSTLASGTATIQRDCPSSNGTIYSVTSGSTAMQFRKACEATFVNANNLDAMVVQPFDSLDKCINECAQYNLRNRTEIQQGKSRICNSVCWRNDFVQRDKWPGGMCFGWTTQNTTSGGFKYQVGSTFPETACDSAALINQEF